VAIMNFVIKQLDVKNGDYVMLTDSHMEKHLLILIEISVIMIVVVILN
jgi:hypothetical protein